MFLCATGPAPSGGVAVRIRRVICTLALLLLTGLAFLKELLGKLLFALGLGHKRSKGLMGFLVLTMRTLHVL
jgi:hypothetical protein